MNNIYLVEPHGDDALLSAYSLMKENKGNKNFHLITVCAERGSKELAKYFGFTYHFLDTEDLGETRRIRTIERRTKYEGYLDQLCFNDNSIASENKFFYILEFIDEYFTDNSNPLVYLPLGIRHIDHVLTRYAFENRFRNLVYYAENPYACRKYGQVQVNKAMQAYNEVRCSYSSENLKEKKELLERFYFPAGIPNFLWENKPQLEIYFR